MTQSDLTAIIDRCYAAVEASKAGPIWQRNGSEQFLHPLGMQTFLAVLAAQVPHTVTHQMPPEPWQEREES